MNLTSLFSRESNPKGIRGGRGAERFQTDQITTALGDVLDISASGARIEVTGTDCPKRGDSITLSLICNGQVMTIQAQVARVVRKLLQRPQIGVRFINLTPGQAAAVVQMGQFGFVRTAASAGSGAGAGSRSGAAGEKARNGLRAGVEIEDLYAALGVRGDASDAEIRKAYHRLAHELHPDHNTSPGAAERFTLVSKAYSVLKDPTLRARYDTMLARSLAA